MHEQTLNENELMMANECCICLMLCTSHEKVWSEPCGHTFHSACIEEWAMINQTCPVCRNELSYYSRRLCMTDMCILLRRVYAISCCLFGYCIFCSFVLILSVYFPIKDHTRTNNITDHTYYYYT